MKDDIIIIEGLRLGEVPEGSYMMYALPIKMKKCGSIIVIYYTYQVIPMIREATIRDLNDIWKLRLETTELLKRAWNRSVATPESNF